MRSAGLALLILVFGVAAEARKIQVGPEFTFTNARIRRGNSAAGIDVIRRWRQAAERLCQERQDCSVDSITSEILFGHKLYFSIRFADGRWIDVGSDPGVIEVRMRHDEIERLRAGREIADQFIFGLAAQLGVEPHAVEGGGHISIDRETAFENDRFLFRNFLVDHVHHPEWSTGIFGFDFNNAPVLQALGVRTIRVFENAITVFDAIDPGNDWLAEQINSGAYWRTWSRRAPFANWTEKFQNISLVAFAIRPGGRVEWRGVRPQKSYDEFLLQAEFVEARINWLERLNRPLPLEWPLVWNASVLDRVDRFRAVLDEMQLPLERFMPLVDQRLMEQARRAAIRSSLGQSSASRILEMAQIYRGFADAKAREFIESRPTNEQFLGYAALTRTEYAFGLLIGYATRIQMTRDENRRFAASWRAARHEIQRRAEGPGLWRQVRSLFAPSGVFLENAFVEFMHSRDLSLAELGLSPSDFFASEVARSLEPSACRGFFRTGSN